MSDVAPTSKSRRVRRQVTDEFRAGAVRLVVDEHRSIAQVPRDLDLPGSSGRTSSTTQIPLLLRF